MITWIVGGVLALLVAFALLAPLESLRWWSRRGALEARRTFELVRTPQPDAAAASDSSASAPPSDVPPTSADSDQTRFDKVEHIAFYLSGVGVVDGVTSSPKEHELLDRVRAALPHVLVLEEVFPYAVDNRGLPQRATSWLWERLIRLRAANKRSLAPNLINLRNILQVLVSADPRYGPSFNAGIALAIWRVLVRQGYRPGCGVPVTIIGYSGGAQMAVGSATLLAMLGVGVRVVSIGGVFGDDPGLDHVEHLYDIRGSRDRLRLIGPLVFPGRWPVLRGSSWWRAVRDGRVTILDAGPADHDGRDSYFDSRHPSPDGTLPADRVLGLLVDILR